MGRKMVLRREGESIGKILEEVQAHDEAQLQEQMKENPDLLPIEEYELSGPLMVVGRETVLPSGSVDLICLTRSGELLLVEFKTGPKNPDFRHTLAQLLDYGSHLWGMEYEVFEEAVPRSYFASDRCPSGSPVWRKTSLEDASRVLWPDVADEEISDLRGNLSKNLKDGRIRYIAVAQRFTEQMLKTVDYLNAQMQNARFYAVELVRFKGDEVSAFEARTVLKPARASTSGSGPTDRQRFLEAFSNEEYRDAVRDFLEAAEGLDLKFYWGTQGMSIRIPVPEKPDGLSVGWVYPPGSVGWMGTNDVSLGYDRETAKQRAVSVLPILEKYSTEISKIADANKIPTARLDAYRFSPKAFLLARDRLVQALRALLSEIAGE